VKKTIRHLIFYIVNNAIQNIVFYMFLTMVVYNAVIKDYSHVFSWLITCFLYMVFEIMLTVKAIQKDINE